uniref:Uncharacterized protein n=1 Tax=Arundo donax TaxID=35708 RepID=A0A0A9B6P5_ARUDO
MHQRVRVDLFFTFACKVETVACLIMNTLDPVC